MVPTGGKMRRILFLISIILFLFVYSIANGDCPEKNIVEKMTTTMTSFKAVSPLDHNIIRSGGAQLNKAGTKLTVSLSNMEGVSISKLANDFVLPITKKDQFIVDIEFRNAKKEIISGTYKGSSGYGKSFWAFAEVKLHKGVKGVVVSLGIREGEAVITKMDNNMICGKFNLMSKKGSTQNSYLSGEFNVKLERSRW